MQSRTTGSTDGRMANPEALLHKPHGLLGGIPGTFRWFIIFVSAIRSCFILDSRTWAKPIVVDTRLFGCCRRREASLRIISAALLMATRAMRSKTSLLMSGRQTDPELTPSVIPQPTETLLRLIAIDVLKAGLHQLSVAAVMSMLLLTTGAAICCALTILAWDYYG
jgi:hypothetical protein